MKMCDRLQSRIRGALLLTVQVEGTKVQRHSGRGVVYDGLLLDFELSCCVDPGA